MEQFVDTLCTGKQTAVVVGEDDIAGLDEEVTEARGAQRRGVTGVEPLWAGRTDSIAENGQTNLPKLGCVPMRAPDDDSTQPAVFGLERGQIADADFVEAAAFAKGRKARPERN